MIKCILMQDRLLNIHLQNASVMIFPRNPLLSKEDNKRRGRLTDHYLHFQQRGRRQSSLFNGTPSFGKS